VERDNVFRFIALELLKQTAATALIIVSAFSKGGGINNTYTDHVSILKFIERNWNLKPLTGRSRDNLPNPVSHKDNVYVPQNSPAIGDLFDMFDFDYDNGRGQGDLHGEK